LEQYSGCGEGDIFERLASIQQEGSVEEYISEFEQWTAQIPRLPDDQYFGNFIHGLQEGIKGRVRSMHTMGPLPCSRRIKTESVAEWLK